MKPLLIPFCACVLAAPSAAQAIAFAPAAVGPGTTLTIFPSGSPANPLFINGTNAFLLTDEGDLVTPRFRQGATTVFGLIGPGLNLPLQIPASGPGSSGSHVVFVPSNSSLVGQVGAPGFAGLVARVDVGSVTPGFAALHTFPMRVASGFGSYSLLAGSAPGFGSADWCFANTSFSSVSLTAGDIQVIAPDGTTVLAFTSLSGLTVPPGFCVSITALPATLPPGPYTVQATWADPLAGPVVRRTGIHLAAPGSATADLHLPNGRTIPPGGSIETYVQIGGFFSQSLPACALMVGTLPGGTVMPNGALVPLLAEPLVLASLSGALSPLLLNSPQVAGASGPGCFGYCGPVTGFGTASASGILLSHPGPALSGTVLRLAALALIGSSQFVASQAQEIVLQ